MFKFIHAADIHLDSPLLKLDAYEGAPVGEIRGATRRAFENLVQAAVDEKVAFVLIAGDLYDGDWKDYNTGLYFASRMGKLREAGIRVLVTAGNHDAASSITKSLRLPENVQLFPADRPATIHLEGLDVAVHGQSFGFPAVTTDLSRRYPAAVPGCFNIGLLHTCVNGREGHAPYAPCTLDGLRDTGYDYWALGHVHQREVLLDNPWVVFAGNTQGRHARETGPKGCLLVSVGGSERPVLDFRPLDVVRWEVAGIDAGGAERGYDVVDRFRGALSALLARNPDVLSVARVLIDGETHAHDELMADPERWANEIRSVAVDEGGDRVWVEKVKLRTRPPAAKFLNRDGAVGELLGLMDELAADPEALRGLGSELADLEKKLPREFREGAEGWRPDAPGWLAGLLSEVRPMLVQRLLRKKAAEWKILRLDLMAYGPFTDTVIDLAVGEQGLHIVYGPNEAGKSSALRALRHLLYGIPERTPDAFRHPFAKLRIGAALKSAGGDVLEVVRRKGRGSTLRAVDDKTAIEETELQRFMNGVDADLFATMFGIGYEDLVRGGREIIQGGGDLGRLIFAAGSGASNLGAVLDELQSDADALFRPSGQKQKINEAVGRLKQYRLALKESQLPGQEWVRHDRALKAAQDQKNGVEEKLAAAQRRLNRLQRISAAHPVIARRREILKGLADVADAVLLPEGFGHRRTDALTRLRVSENERDQAHAALSNLRASMAELGEPAALLDQAEVIEELHQDLGSQRKAAKDRIALETRRNTLRTEARQLLRSLRDDLAIEEAERLRVKKPEAVRIQELGAEYERIATRIESGREKIPEHTRQIAGVEARLAALAKPRSVDALKAALVSAEEALTFEQQLKAVRTEQQVLQQACEQGRARLGLSATPLEALGRLPAPALETIQVFEERFDGLERRLSALSEEARKTAASLSETGRRLEEARLEREVPTEADLESARELRNRGWGLIARRLNNEAVSADTQQLFMQSFPGKASLSAAFAASIETSDALADRLRREADRVAVKARLLADQAAFTEQFKQLGVELAAARDEKETAAVEWAGVWQPFPVAPRSPREMRQWRQDFRTLVEKASEALSRSHRLEALQAEVDGVRSELGRCLESLGEPAAAEAETLSGRVKRVRRIVAAEEELGRQREELDREKSRFENELQSAAVRLQASEGELRRWQKDWEQAVKPLGLAADARPVAANAVMEELKRFFDMLREAEVLQQRLDGIERDAEAFTRKVKALAGAVAVDLAARPADEAAVELQRRLTGARQRQSKRQALQKQSDQAQAKMQQAALALAEIESQLKGMCREAGCRVSDELPAAERRSVQRLQLEDRLREENERLLQLGGGAAVDEFVNAAAAIDPDGIKGDIERLEEEARQLSGQKSELDQAIGKENAELSRMDGGNRAAGIAEEMQAILGGLERDVEQYARLKIATRVMTLAIERFREKSQGPILTRASNLFRRITCGSFEGVRADHDPEGNPVLVGVRTGGRQTVPVEGMSDGTADQLYLALRLAGLEHYLDENEPMPFIVDDILIKFDNHRAAAALQALAEISARTQVIFFTHHRHLTELAAAHVDTAVLFAHGLG